MDKYFPDEEDVDAAISAPNVDASGAFAVRIKNSYQRYCLTLISSTRIWVLLKVGSVSGSRKHLLHYVSSFLVINSYFANMSFLLKPTFTLYLGSDLGTTCYITKWVYICNKVFHEFLRYVSEPNIRTQDDFVAFIKAPWRALQHTSMASQVLPLGMDKGKD